MSRHAHDVSVAAILTVALLMSGCGADRAAQPNVVIIVSDDQGWGDVGYNGSEIRTPNIDQLAAEGVKFDRFYVHPLCSPTRGALMTGRSPLNTGVLVPFGLWFETGLPTDEKLLPEYFRDAGYQTFAVGKWHLGPNKREYYPHNRGFDHFYGHLGGFINHYLHTVWGGVDWQRNGKTVIEDFYATHLITREATQLIRMRDPARPMLLYVAYNTPHSPLQAPPEAVDSYAAIEDEDRRTYAAMVTEMDNGIGEIRAALAEQGLLENTLIWFMSDNGGSERLGADNGPLRGGKADTWEGGIRVPAVARWPSKLSAGEAFTAPLTVHDVLPTLLAAVGIQAKYPKPLDGRDVWPAISNRAPLEPQPMLFVWRWITDPDYRYAFFDGEWKLIQLYDSETQTFRQELFRISDDPLESEDLADRRPEVVAEMMQAFEALPKAKMHGLGAAPLPTITGPGGPGSAIPDDGPPRRRPYAESDWQATP